MDGCIATAVNVVSSAFGGALGKLAARYGAPWKWEKAAALASRVKGLLVDLVDKAKAFIKCKNSFVPGTLVVMADGSRKPIEDVKTGDVVLVTDPVTGKTTTKPVVATIIGQGTKHWSRSPSTPTATRATPPELSSPLVTTRSGCPNSVSGLRPPI